MKTGSRKQLTAQRGSARTHRLVRRGLAVLPAACAQVLWLYLVYRFFQPYAVTLNLLLSLCALVFVLYLMTKREEGAYKTLWLLVILAFPLLGAFLYCCFGNKRTARPLQKKLNKAGKAFPLPCSVDPPAMAELSAASPRLAQTFRYVERKTGFRVLRNQSATYYPLGDDMFPAMLRDLEKAERYIFAEYFIVHDGQMWGAVEKILIEKAAAGLDVRLLYDDVGSIATYSKEDAKLLQSKGVHVASFNPLVVLTGTLNYRDHRKMLIVDGKVAFSGGINLADEYINRRPRFGHWKDIGFRLAGPPVQSYTRMFCEFWNAFSKHPIPAELSRPSAVPDAAQPHDGLVLSYYDSPLYPEAVSNGLYMDLLAQAQRCAWFFTPYLMLGDGLLDAFVRAAERGVDVRVFMPGIPDKKLVFRMSRSYYPVLLEAGVRIFEYTPGFLHAKACLVDDDVGAIGTVNLDYRSLFLHFENNALFYRASILSDLKQDFTATQQASREITPAALTLGFPRRMLDGLLRIFAPLC